MSTTWTLRVGAFGPRQQGPTRCAAACLVVAHMLADADFAAWVRAGNVGVEPVRFAAAEWAVTVRTHAPLTPAGWVRLPWPTWLGTPPSRVRTELERTGLRYRLRLMRHRGPEALRASLANTIAPGVPAVLYVGSALLPRHVTLAFVSEGGPALYDPLTGRVVAVEDLDVSRDGVGGWRTSWWVLVPDRHQL